MENNDDFITLFDLGSEKLRAKIKYVGGKASGRYFDNPKMSDANKYNTIELNYIPSYSSSENGYTEVFEVWGEESPNLEEDPLSGIDILFGFSAMIIKNNNDLVPYEDFCSMLEGNLWDIDIAVSYARTCEYIHKLKNLGLTLDDISDYSSCFTNNTTSLDEVRELYEDSHKSFEDEEEDDDYYYDNENEADDDYPYDSSDFKIYNGSLEESKNKVFSSIYKKFK